jgi:hypothetical protein
MIRLFFCKQNHTIHARTFLNVLLLTVLCLASTLSRADDLTANVDRTSISLQDTFTLTLRATGQTGRDEPDFTVLQRDFDILNNQRSNQMRVINNQMESWTEWRLALAPKHTGHLTIPAFELSGRRSNPLTINVLQQHQITGDTQQDIFIELELDKNALYVQEQLLLTVRLYTTVNLRAADLQRPELPDAVVVEVAENRFQRQIDGHPHGVIENTFAIFPQSSGELVIPSLSYNVSVSSGQRDIWGDIYGGGGRNLRRLRTEEQRLKVKTIPATSAGQPWLPANELTLSQHWSSAPDNLRVGEPVTRTITISATGLSAGQLPPITVPGIDGLTYYPDQPQTDEQRNIQGISSKRIETLAIVPQRSGTMTLPEVTLDWWNTATGTMETARLPATSVNVRPAPGTPEQPAAPSASGSRALPGDLAELTPTTGTPTLPIGWWLSNAILALVCLLFAALYLNSRRQLQSLAREREAAQTQSRIAEVAAWKQLKRASARQDFKALRQGLIAWARLHWHNDRIHNLQDILRHTHSERLHERLKAFDTALYGTAEQQVFDPGELLQEIQQLRKLKRDRKAQDSEQPLAPLYPG